MPAPETILLAAAIFAAALLYSSVGHGGASAYLAVMALAGFAPAVMRPTALVLNLFVAGIAAIQFARAGHFSWRLFWPFALGSIPLAFVGGTIHLPTDAYKQILGAVLLFAAVRLVFEPRRGAPARAPMPLWLAVLVGACVGLLSGLTGVGGGIFLSPILLVGGWAQPKPVAAVSAAFIWVNSLAGLAGQAASLAMIPVAAYSWGAAAVFGGLLGSTYASRRLPGRTLKRLLAAVLVVAGVKMLLT
ncbi:MAG TPA: sulfite exporter TauE/SafE family protein [Thermoanaerobaculia bacterium]|nr:sulfite exporter TauE/SafE family protein [Thermoanaerobaculia bacterium]